MEFNGLLTIVTFLPLLGSLLLLLFPKKWAGWIKWTALGFTALNLIISIFIWTQFKTSVPGFQLIDKVPWVESVGITYFFGVDGMSMLMLFLTTLLSFVACLASFNIDHRNKEYYSLFLLLETGLIGVFVSLDLVLFYVFWELVLVPMYFLIGIWGGPRKLYASIKFFIYTLVGSLFMLVGVLAIYFASGQNTFSIPQLIETSANLRGWALGLPVFGALFLGFAIKVPSFPFHTWLPDAHVEAPAPISILLAGVLLKMGGYGLIRIGVGIMPYAATWWADIIGILGVIGIVYGAFCSLVQKDLKKLVAYTSVNHMGFVLLAVAAFLKTGAVAALQGAVLVMFNHGITTGLLFLLVGYIYDRTHTREIAKLPGMASIIPIISIMLIIASFASIGLPALAGFVSEFLSMTAAYQAVNWWAWVSVVGMIINGGVMLWMMQRVLFGTVADPHFKELRDASFREFFAATPLLGFIFFIGIFPMPLLNMIQHAITTLPTLPIV
ncbi:MAG TPA: NADH-quinone oxidoreductase subunit M [Caldisericia bacterium]|nr:NADH-quinone oxidoreductase subunit M [Caldisericia bacterium]HOC79014.1 NADH-quinone oxidoreductase subunit M [Caldisericia bacterium]HOG69814.1 NADH-quinone oxidoreductase subunit M [Caldisericia bacterium]HPA65299.1 NADH-quinone oxidoreductase subunit M [Caldisericia bacterium]HPM44759.1 NADH-quinone oxidoreductase subunit M [Caldisericia bacterium]